MNSHDKENPRVHEHLLALQLGSEATAFAVAEKVRPIVL